MHRQSPALRSRLRSPRRVRWRRSHAVVSVVGTLLSLLVFFALFGIFVTQYVPVWMDENEQAFSDDAQRAFAELKANIDLQSELAGPPILAAPLPLSSDGIPLFAQPTTAVLNYIPHTYGVYANITMQYGPGGKPNFVYNQTLGTVRLTIPNRYYPPQVFEFEDDAVIQSQGGSQQSQQALLYPPIFTINTSGTYRQVTMGLLQLYGNATQVVSSGTIEVFSRYGTQQQFPSNGSVSAPGTPFNVTLKLGTSYGCGWVNYLAATLNASQLPKSFWTLSPSSCAGVVYNSGGSTMITMTLRQLSKYDLIVNTATIFTGVGQG
jgi:hypothetical protein